ncbi:DUF262 domain-containing protein [Lactonifactor longoviformis]|uniref:DUF262 domain-containing protein n=1 Tax=Lactonifactor longoviformis TaxID=341220 RepID=UPI00210AE895|nr:DUF262 domain-containing protein [Lactonifactor longoviformis]MCQ4669753.1 DUF262 domain-containing protein [Lactonifactor longoviformis]
MDIEAKKILLEKQISDERARLSSDRMDISFGELMNLYNSDELIIRPEYQRLFRWTTAQKTGLIESILLGIPVPPIFVAEDSDGIWELVDGLQRVSTIISFFGKLKDDISKIRMDSESDEVEEDAVDNLNFWELESGSLIAELEGFTANTLPQKYLINIKRAVCRVEILRGESNTAMKYELFKRLNSGGSKLTAQEIRNAIYRGIDSSVNELVEELSKNSNFLRFTQLSKQKKQELYDQELILRFIAFYNSVEKINSNTETYLDNFMQESVENGNFDVEKYRRLFKEVMELLGKHCDDNIFRNERNSFVPALFEGITLGIAENMERYKKNPDLINEKICVLKQDGDFKRFSGSASNSKSRIRNRLGRVKEIFGNSEE